MAKTVFAGSMIFVLAGLCIPAGASPDTERPPNFVVIFTDDQGYHDLGCFGSEKIRTPNVDRLADEGMRLRSFYAQAVCGPSRAALMTGCYPVRVGEPDNTKHQHTILHTEEMTFCLKLSKKPDIFLLSFLTTI